METKRENAQYQMVDYQERETIHTRKQSRQTMPTGEISHLYRKRDKILGHSVHKTQYLLNNISIQDTPPTKRHQQQSYTPKNKPVV